MRLNINLATQPYENVRRFLVQWVSLLVVSMAITAALVYAGVVSLRTLYHTRQLIAEEHEKLIRLEQQENADLAVLNQPQNRDVRDKSRLINGLIRRKQFSWTLIFSDLERIMPSRLHVVSITPQLDAANRIEVRMLVAGASRDKAIELVQKMEQSKTFRYPLILTENYRPERTAEDAVQLEISALYVPSTAQRSGD